MQMTIQIFQKIVQTIEDIRERNLSSERSSCKKSRRISSTSSRGFSAASSSSDEEQQSKRRKKKHKKKKSKKHRRTKSPTSQTSRFGVVNQEDQFKWELSDIMVECANYHLNIFVQEKDLNESILKTNPVPSNLQQVRRMDEFMAQLLKEKRQKILLQQDAIYEKISKEKTYTLRGHCVSYGKVQKLQIKSKIHLSINDLIKFVTQNIILVGQNPC